jgi:hypothetical protein
MSVAIDYGLFDNNGGASILYKKNVKNLDLYGGIGFRSIDWGNQVEVEFGIYKSYWRKNKMELGQTFSIRPSVPLFYRKLLIGGGVGSNFNVHYLLTERLRITVLVGIRFDMLPGYRDFSSIWNTSEFRFGLQFSRALFLDKAED